MARGKRRKPRPSRLRRALRSLVSLLLFTSGLAGAGVYWMWPDTRAIAQGPVLSSSFIEAFTRATGRRPRVQWRAYEHIDADLKLAVLVAEDARFFEHGAIDLRELSRAIEDTLLRDRRMRGASTLTQQLAKNLWLSSDRSAARKLREAFYAYALEHELSKRRILELYLNLVEMGPGIFGAEAAAQHFYGVEARDLSREQAAQLAASLSRPSIWYPNIINPRYRQRVQHILREMKRSPSVARRL